MTTTRCNQCTIAHISPEHVSHGDAAALAVVLLVLFLVGALRAVRQRVRREGR